MFAVLKFIRRVSENTDDKTHQKNLKFFFTRFLGSSVGKFLNSELIKPLEVRRKICFKVP